MGRGNLATLTFDLLTSQWPPNFSLWEWDPFPSPSHPSGAGPILPPLLLPSHSPPHPMSYLVAGGSFHPLRWTWSPTGAW